MKFKNIKFNLYKKIFAILLKFLQQILVNYKSDLKTSLFCILNHK